MSRIKKMRLPVCNFDIESNMLCPNCQERLDKGEITDFDIEFSRWILEKEKEFETLNDLHLLRAISVSKYLILIVKKRQAIILTKNEKLMEELREEYGEVLIFEGTPKLRSVVRTLIAPAVEVGVNSLYLPTGGKESIVMLRDSDKSRIKFTPKELRIIVSQIMNESVLFEYQGDREKEEEKKGDEFDERMKELAQRRRRVR